MITYDIGANTFLKYTIYVACMIGDTIVILKNKATKKTSDNKSIEVYAGAPNKKSNTQSGMNVSVIIPTYT